MHILLHQPQIPQNTGNIGRLCVATQTPLFLVPPLGFLINSKEIRRSGLDYWKDLNLTLVEDFKNFQTQNRSSNFWFFSTKGKKSYTSVTYQESDFLVFGNESAGLPKEILEENESRLLTIPMWGPVRSLNLSTSVGIVLYEAYRQVRGF